MLKRQKQEECSELQANLVYIVVPGQEEIHKKNLLSDKQKDVILEHLLLFSIAQLLFRFSFVRVRKVFHHVLLVESLSSSQDVSLSRI